MNEFKLREAKDIAEHGSDEEVNRHLQRMTRVDRRVVSRKETIGYMFFDGSSGFNIDSQRELFVDSILQIDLKKQSQFNIFAGIWDIVDDIVIGGIIEKTRTRWGKFVPYFFLVGIPYAIVVGLYWMLPLFFSEEHVNDLNYIPKFIAFIVKISWYTCKKFCSKVINLLISSTWNFVNHIISFFQIYIANFTFFVCIEYFIVKGATCLFIINPKRHVAYNTII